MFVEQKLQKKVAAGSIAKFLNIIVKRANWQLNLCARDISKQVNVNSHRFERLKNKLGTVVNSVNEPLRVKLSGETKSLMN